MELLIAIVVIGILAAVTIASYSGMQERGRVSSRQADLRALSNKAVILGLDGYSFTDSRLWKQALINSSLYASASTQTTPPLRSIAVCSNSSDFALANIPYGLNEANFTDIVVSYSGKIDTLHWDSSVTGASTLEKLCKQVNLNPLGFSNWAHNTGIRDAAAL